MTAGKFICPECHKPALTVGASIELPPDRSSDEITLQLVECTNCRFGALAVYEESRRGRLDSEATRHTGYRAGAKIRAAIGRAIAQCPAPDKSGCGCLSHAFLGEQTSDGAWDGLARNGIGTADSFAIRLAR